MQSFMVAGVMSILKYHTALACAGASGSSLPICSDSKRTPHAMHLFSCLSEPKGRLVVIIVGRSDLIHTPTSSNSLFTATGPSPFPVANTPLLILLVVVVLKLRFPRLHQLLMGRQDKYLHHEQSDRWL